LDYAFLGGIGIGKTILTYSTLHPRAKFFPIESWVKISVLKNFPLGDWAKNFPLAGLAKIFGYENWKKTF